MNKIGDTFIIEGYCYTTEDNYPCHRDGVSSFCLQNGICPLFDYEDGDIREGMKEVPLYKLLWDRFIGFISDNYWKVWYALGFGTKDIESLKELGLLIKEDNVEFCPEIVMQVQDEKNKFKKWFDKVREGEEDGDLSNMW